MLNKSFLYCSRNHCKNLSLFILLFATFIFNFSLNVELFSQKSAPAKAKTQKPLAAFKVENQWIVIDEN
jgi:hypothetical protein